MHLVVVVRSWGVTAKHLIDSSEKHICQLKALNFRVCMLLKGTSNIISGICCLKGYNFWYIYFQEWDRRFNYFIITKISLQYYSNKGVNSMQSLAYYSDEDFIIKCLLTDLGVDIQILSQLV